MIHNMKKICSFIFICSIGISNNMDVNAAINSSFGNSYDFYSFSENRLDINFFYNDLQGWVQYEYSNPPDIGFPVNDIRKFRLEYGADNFLIKVGDIYEFWGRGLVLNQLDDQVTNFDNGTRGLSLEFNRGPLTLNHINGSSDMWSLGADLRVPSYNNIHSMAGNRLHLDLSSMQLGITHLLSNEEHDKMFGPSALVNHRMKGVYGSWVSNNADVFVEYVDKVSTERLVQTGANDSLKTGHGIYANYNFYFGNWGLSTEYKRYAFDAAHGDLTADDYGNQIEYQQTPTLGKEQNSTLLGRLTHNYNLNDERGVQFELNGSLMGLTVVAQYAHLSRNENWQSVTSSNWEDQPLEDYLPSSNESALPYWENYQEISGYALNDKLYFKLGRGNNKEVLKTTRYFEGMQSDIDTTHSYVTVIDTVIYSGEEYYIENDVLMIDTTFGDEYNIESKLWQQSKAFSIPMEVNYIFNNGYTFGIGFQYQEREKVNIKRGNSTGYSTADGAWTLVNPDDVTETNNTRTTQLSNSDGSVDRQYNRLIYLSLSKASKWSFTITHDWTNAYEASTPIDPYYNPLEALIYGDLKYFTGERDNVDPPAFVKNRWISAELSLNLTSSQRLSIMYGSIQGGLFCSNGICRLIPPFNDGLKISYSASF